MDACAARLCEVLAASSATGYRGRQQHGRHHRHTRSGTLSWTCRSARLRGSVHAQGRSEPSPPRQNCRREPGIRFKPTRRRRRAPSGDDAGVSFRSRIPRVMCRGRGGVGNRKIAAATGRAIRHPSLHSVRSARRHGNRYAVLCMQDRPIPRALQRRMVAENPCADVVELDTFHTPHLSKANELAEALKRFAALAVASDQRPAAR